MTTVHLIRGRIGTNALTRWAGERGWTGGRAGTFDRGRAIHHLVDEMFGPSTLRPFRLLVPQRHSEGNLYAYAASDATDLKRAADIQAKPDHLGVLPLERLESKPMPGDWTKGQRVGFNIRVRPIRRIGKAIEAPSGKIPAGSELDAFLLEAIRRHPDERSGMRESERTREAVYLDWLADRFRNAARLDARTSRVVQFHRTVVSRGTAAVEGPDAVVHGTLTIEDREQFNQLLRRGVGRHRAFGYGMILLGPPSRQLPDK